MDDQNDVDPLELFVHKINTLLVPYVHSLELSDKFIVQQYTHHGDEIINSFLRGEDTIETYNENIISDYLFHPVRTIFHCIYLEEIFKTLPDNVKDKFNNNILESFYTYKTIRDEIKKKGGSATSELDKFVLNYNQYVYKPIIRERILANDLDYFRTLTYTIIQKLNRIITISPRLDYVFTVYRGIKNRYLSQDSGVISKLTSFHSTTIDLDVTAKEFGKLNKLIYVFKVHPECNYIYTEPVTLHKYEYEFVFTPGNRYVYLSEEVKNERSRYGIESWTYITYAVLPPEQGYELPETYQDYLTYLRSVQAEHTLAEQNRTSIRSVRNSNGR